MKADPHGAVRIRLHAFWMGPIARNEGNNLTLRSFIEIFFETVKPFGGLIRYTKRREDAPLTHRALQFTIPS